MFFQRIEPDKVLADLIECYWIAENEDNTPVREKIIPDGFTELIFHFGDPYRIQLNGSLQLQGKSLLAGQISKHFYLENCGRVSIIGIKLKPTALSHLFNLSMHDYTNRVADIHTVAGIRMNAMEKLIRSTSLHRERIGIINEYFRELLPPQGFRETPADRAVNLLLEKNGMVAIAEICKTAGVGERQLENLFKQSVGLSPKLFARIIRFNYIFHLIEQNDQSWCGLAYEAAYYDQSHFIRNFKSFTGESPGAYSFDEKNMANFFLKKK